MDRNDQRQRTVDQETGHLSEDDLLHYADGELKREQAQKTEVHLEACWSCRTRSERYEATIRDYIDYRETVQKGVAGAPPGGWRGFNRMLEELVIAKRQRSPVSRVLGWFGNLQPSFSINPQFAGRMAAALVLAVLATAILVIRSDRVTVVSAKELLQHSANAQAALMRAIPQPVFHQRMRVRRVLTSQEETLTWDVWDDRVNARFVQSSKPYFEDKGAGRSEAQSAYVTHTKPDMVISELGSVLASNHMDPRRPLAAVSYESWHSTLHNPLDEISKIKRDGEDVLVLHTAIRQWVHDGEITDARLVVRASDWLPSELQITVQSSQGNRAYEVTATVSEVINLPQIDPAICLTAGKPDASSSAPLSGVAKPSNESPIPALPALTPKATAEAEVEVLRLLHEASADLGEQVAVSRNRDGAIRVGGIVDSDRRKQEILNALRPVLNNPSIKVEIETLSEAISRRANKQSASVVAGTLSTTEGTSIPADTELRRYFKARGVPPEQLDEEIRQFSSRVVARSRQAMQRAFAVRRLANQFDSQQLRTLSPEARTKLFTLIANHTAAFEQQTRLLRQEIELVFGSSVGSPDRLPEINDEDDFVQATERLLELAKDYDRAVGSAFAISSNKTSSGIRTEPLWHSLRAAEALASRIRQVRNLNLGPKL